MPKNQNLNSFSALCTANDGYVQHGPIPNFSIGGQNAFTLEATVVFQNDAGNCIIYGQDGVFSFGINASSIYFNAPGFCSIATSKIKFPLTEQNIYYICLRYDMTKVDLFVQGYKLAEAVKSGSAPVKNVNYTIGNGAIGGIVTLRVFSEALTDVQIYRDFMNQGEPKDTCVAWFVFNERAITDKSKNQLPIFMDKAEGVQTKNYAACSAFLGTGCATTKNVIKDAQASYSIIGKIYPNFSRNDMVIYSSLTASAGFTLFLQKQSDQNYKICCSYNGGQLNGTAVITAQCWFDFALTYNGQNLILYVDGVSCGQIALTNLNLVGSETIYIGAEVNTSGVISYKRGYNGFMGYIAEFAIALDSTRLSDYIDSPPYVFDLNVLSVMVLNTSQHIEAVYNQVINKTGGLFFVYANGTQAISTGVGVSYYFPETEDPEWNNLSDDDKWKIQYYCDLCLIQMKAVMGFDLNFPSSLTLSKNGASALVRMGVTEMDVEEEYTDSNAVVVGVIVGVGVALATGAYLYMTSHVFAATGAGYFALVTGMTLTAATTALTISAVAEIIVTALTVGAVAGVVAAIIIIAIEDNTTRPTNQNSNLKIESIQVDFNGNITEAGIHCRKNASLAINPIATKDNTNNIEYIGVIVPSKLSTLKITVTVSCTDAVSNVTLKGSDTAMGNYLGQFQSAPFSIAGGASVSIDFSVDISTRTWKIMPCVKKLISRIGWHFAAPQGSDIFIMNTDQTLYTLLDVPLPPWDTSQQDYTDTNTAYVWTDILDVCVASFAETAQTDKSVSAHLSAYTASLNASGKFMFDNTKGDSHFFSDQGIINATAYLAALADTIKAEVDSTDCAGIIVLEGTISGIDTAIMFLSAPREINMELNAVIYIGDTTWRVPFNGSAFFHAVAVLANKLASTETKVFDACFKIDSGPYPGLNGTAHTKTALLAVDYTFAQTDNIIVDVPTITEYSASFYRERLIKTGTGCEFSEKSYLQGQI